MTATLLCTSACSPFPRDPHASLDKIQERGVLRVGATEAPPWLWRRDGRAAGVEAQLIEAFAAELGVEVRWHWGGEQDHFEALEAYDLDLVAGGLTDQTPWEERVSLTRPYYRHHASLGLPPAVAAAQRPTADPATVATSDTMVSPPPPPEPVLVRPASGLSQTLRARGIRYVERDNLSTETSAVAAQDWELRRWGLVDTEMALREYARVMAVPEGENALLMRLERFLRSQSAGIDPTRVAEAAP